ncbi:hypothetical protein MCUN1_002222 [Malassezia cuniculi]|uniref:Uncharacterized protein n=1 Tax=Malassezia cuniculi TaxID=948313 RepID=A0AAF0J6L9_9BASI|nr:hypothetical protein MCUN1_002222 [Malassezia cuniculi]
MRAVVFAGRLAEIRASRLHATGRLASAVAASQSHVTLSAQTHIDWIARTGHTERIPIPNARALAAGFHFGWAIGPEGAASWGSDTRGQTAGGGAVLRDASQVASGLDHALLLSGDQVYTCGRAYMLTVNTDGQLGRGSRAYERELAPVDIPARVVRVRAGGDTSLAIADDSVWVWGNAEYGQALGPAADRIPAPMRGELAAEAGRVVDAAVGGSFVLLLNDHGEVYAAGYGALGTGHVKEDVPRRITGLPPIADISAGLDYAAALTTDGCVYAWGINRHGRLGDGVEGKEHVYRPALVEYDGRVSSVACGSDALIALAGVDE